MPSGHVERTYQLPSDAYGADWNPFDKYAARAGKEAKQRKRKGEERTKGTRGKDTGREEGSECQLPSDAYGVD